MYHFKDNPLLKTEISIYKEFQLVSSVNKNNFDTDEDAYDFVEFLVESLNKNS